MAKAVTEKYEEMILDVEVDPIGAPGVYTSLCGVTDVTITRTSKVDETEVPDCDDESLPVSIEKAVRSQDVTVDGTGVWAQSSHGEMIAWWYSGKTKNIRLRNTKAATGDILSESGPALLITVTDKRTKGQKVTRDINIAFDGVPTVGLAA